jgi:CheY-like chemotaxis protein
VVLIADPEIEQGKSTASALAQWGFQPTLVHDGVEAILAIQRLLPRAIVIDAALPKMFGFQICEIVKRNESLRDIHVVLVGAIHNRARYRRPPEEIYGADAYIERQELPESLRPILQEFGMLSSALQAAPASVTAAAPLAPPVDVPTPSVAPTPSMEPTVSVAPVPSVEPAPPVAPAPPMEPTASVAPVPSVESASPIAPTPPMEPAASDSPASPIASAPSMEPTPSVAPAVAPLPVAGVPVAPKITEPAVSTETSVTPRAPEEVAPTAPASGDPGIDEKIEQAERLARIVVSDIVLYSKDKFEAAVEAGNVLEAMQPEIAEGRSLFTARIDPAIQKTRDFLTEELLRVAETRSKP